MNQLHHQDIDYREERNEVVKGRVRRHRSNTGRNGAKKSRRGSLSSRMRTYYFTLSAVFGYVLGAALVMISLDSAVHRQVVNSRTLMFLAPGLLLAIIGGAITARAYHAARRRR